MAGATRDFQITYGALTVGASANRQLHGKISTERSGDQFSIDFSFVSRADTPAAMATEIALVEEAFRTPNQILQVRIGDGQSNALHYDLSHALASGFDSKPAIMNRVDGFETALSRLYTVRVVLQLPADRLADAGVGRLGRRDSTVSVAFSENRIRTVTISGVYTGIPTGGNVLARTQYEAQIGVYAGAVLASIDAAAAWELVGEPQTEVDDTVDTAAGVGRGHVIRFTREYREIIYKQAGAGTLDNPDIFDQKLTITRHRGMPIDAGSTVRRLDFAEVRYSCLVSKTYNPDSDRVRSLRRIWEEIISPYILAEASTFFGSQVVITQESVDLNPDAYSITAFLTSQGVVGQLIHQQITVEDSWKTGVVVAPIWDRNSLAKYSYQGPGQMIRTITSTRRMRDLIIGHPFAAGLPAPRNGKVLEWTKTHAPVRFRSAADQGLEGDKTLLTDVTERQVIEYFMTPGQAGIPGEELQAVPNYTNPDTFDEIGL